MEIPDCAYADLKAPSSVKKADKCAIDFEHNDDNPNAELKKMREAWHKIINEYQVELEKYFQASPAPK